MQPIWELLERTRLVRAAHEVTGEGHSDRAYGRFNALTDPMATLALAAEVVAKCRTNPNVIVVPEGIDAAVLGFAVAQERGIPVVSLVVDEGLALLSGDLPAQPQVLILAPQADDLFVHLVGSRIQAEQGTVIEAIALLKVHDAAMNALVDLRARRFPPAACPICASNPAA